MHLPDRSVTVSHLSHLIVGTGGPQYFDLLSLGVGDNLTADVGLVGFVEDIDSHVDDHIGIVNLLIWSETELLDSESLTTGKSWSTSHKFIDIG